MNADEVEYPPDALLEAYLGIAEEFYREDRLDLAMRVVDDRLTIELERDAPPSLLQRLRSTAFSARQKVERVLRRDRDRKTRRLIFIAVPHRQTCPGWVRIL